MANKVDELEQEVLEKLLPYLTQELQKMAKSSGWPSDISSSLSVEEENHDIAVTYPEQSEDAIQKLEYGDGIMPPRAVIRPFISRFSPKATEQIADTTLYMFMEGEI